MKTINFSKKIAIVFSLLISCLHGIGQETDPLMSNFFIYATGATGKAGSTAELTLNMHNIEPIYAWACNLVLPEGVTFKSVSLVDGRYPEGHEMEPITVAQEDGSILICGGCAEDFVMTGTDGAIASVTVEIADTITSDEYIVRLKNIYLYEQFGFFLHSMAYTEFKWFIKGNDLPLVEEGKVWSYKRSRLIAPTDVQAEWNEIYSLEGDTVIDSRRCMKLYVTSDSPSESHDHSYLGAMYEEGECVYYIASGSTTPSLLYDFSCEPENTVKVNQFELAIKERKIVKYRGKYLTVIDWSPIEEGEETFYHNIWIEGIGSPLDLLNDTPIWYDGCPYKELVTCKLNDQVIYDKNDFEASAQPVPKEETSQEFFPEGTRWIEIRLDTLEHSSWYSKIDGEWVPNFETIEYNVEGKFILNWNSQDNYTYRYGIDTNSPDWSDSPAFMIYEDKSGDDTNISAAVPSYGENGFIRGEVYQFNWYVGKKLYYQETVGVDDMPLPDGAAMPNILSFEDEFPVGAIHEFGTIEEIKEGDFGGVRPLKYVDLNGVRIIHGIGVTEWNDGECIFGPVKPYEALSAYGAIEPEERHYRSMLVHFERDGEVLYDVWPEKETTTETDFYYYYNGNKIPLILNENKVVVSIPKDCAETSERIRANVQILTTVRDEIFDIFVISRSEFEKLTSMDSWEEDAKSVILTSIYFTEENIEVCASPYLNVRLKKEQDIDILNSYAEEYRLQIIRNVPLLPLWYILSLSLESEKNSVQCANELYETGLFAASVPDLVSLVPIIEPTPLPSVTFTEGQMATIILPVEPDASKGKYYRLDRVEDRQIIFEQELHPQAHVPYIIVPSKDFSIDPNNMGLEELACDTVSIDGVSFIGSYVSKELNNKEGFYIDIIDTTPDCQSSDRLLIGALRAYLTWDDPYNQGGTKGRGDMEIVLLDYGTSIEEMKNEELRSFSSTKSMKNDVFDLSGRKIVNGQSSNRKLHGIYIKNGQKRAR